VSFSARQANFQLHPVIFSLLVANILNTLFCVPAACVVFGKAGQLPASSKIIVKTVA
jgi:hypothetical protein